VRDGDQGDHVDFDCFQCGTTIAGDDVDALGDVFLAHVRAEHDLPYPDQAIRNYAAATQRLTGPSEPVDDVADLAVFPVTEDRIDDWLRFFDHDAFVGKPEWAACYCLEPHVTDPAADPAAGEPPHWAANRAAMVERLRSGRTFGYLGYVDGTPAAWVNASTRNEYALYRRGPDAEPADEQVVGVSCFVVAPPYRGHGIAGLLLDRVLADARRRGADWVEAYPFAEASEDAAANFRGPRSLYDARGFEAVKERSRDVVVRRRV
jgi:GNAT superfamily N-acetyltransferase